MKRRDFLIAAGMTSSSALVYAKAGGAADPLPQTSAANAGEKTAKANAKGPAAGNGKYSHLLSPIKVGNVVLKSRMYSTNATPHYIQGPETFTSDAMRYYYANLAKNGAAIVTCRIVNENPTPRPKRMRDSAHMAIYDFDDYAAQNYLDRMSEGIRMYGSKPSFAIKVSEAPDYKKGKVEPGVEMSAEMLQQRIEDTVEKAKFFQLHGFEMLCLANTLSPYMKDRTDQYGGASVENRARFAKEVYQAVKKACGENFLIEALISIQEPSIRQQSPSDYSLEDVLAYVKEWDGLLDIMQIRVSGGMANHPTGFNSEKDKPLTLRFAQAIKASGTKILMAPNGGFGDLDFNEECLATGKADLISMGHAWIADWEYGKKAMEGRGEDVVPCIMCNKCHGLSNKRQWYSVCSVNPKMWFWPIDRVIEAPAGSKRIAVIGGGPAGMKAALTAAERGHKVTLYEKSVVLGGQARYSGLASFKWPIMDYKDYLIRQVEKAGIEVLVNAEPTPEMIKAKKYDAVIAATGAEPIIPNIPGVNLSNVFTDIKVYATNEKKIGKNVVLLSGGDLGDEGEESQIGIETAIFLAKAGHKVTVLTSRKDLLTPYRVHYPEQIIDTYKHEDNFSFLTGATVTEITTNRVTYTDANGAMTSIPADSVVISVGRKPRVDEALKYAGTSSCFLMIGDCKSVGSMETAVRSAFFGASQI